MNLLDLIDTATQRIYLLTDDEVIIPKSELPPSPEQANLVLHRLTEFILLYGKLRGFPAPSMKERLPDVIQQLREADLSLPLRTGSRIGLNYLKASFPSYWAAGMLNAIHDPLKVRKVAAYRLGLNEKKECFDITLGQIRRGFQVQRQVLSFFPPFTAAQIYRHYLGTADSPKVWDCSCGFGARLLAFYALYPQGHYYGNEPASLTWSNLRVLSLSLDRNPTIMAKGSEDIKVGADLPREELDLVFTSPPYFDRERYFNEPSQCWVKYPAFDAWRDSYLGPTLQAAREAIRPTGHVVFNVHEPLRKTVIEKAAQVGLRLDHTLTMPIKVDHYLRSVGRTAPRSEPVLAFCPHAIIPNAIYPLWDPTTEPAANEEVWVDIANNRYRVSNLGRVIARTRGSWRLLRPTRMQSGYYSIGITEIRGEKAKTCLLPRLVLTAFRGEAPSERHTDIRHLDGDKSNNQLTNLAWGTRSENMQDVILHRSGRGETENTSSESPWYPGYTTDAYLLEVGLDLHAEGKLSINDLSRLWKCSREVASNIVHGETRVNIERKTQPEKQLRRSKERKDKIKELVQQGMNANQINEVLSESLTAQDVYYYKKRAASDL